MTGVRRYGDDDDADHQLPSPVAAIPQHARVQPLFGNSYDGDAARERDQVIQQAQRSSDGDADDQRPLLGGALMAAATTREGGSANAAATTTRGIPNILHALPHISQWLQGVNSQAQLQIHGHRRQGSSGVAAAASESAAGNGGAGVAGGGNGSPSSSHQIDEVLVAGRGNWSDSPPRSRRRGAPYPRSSASAQSLSPPGRRESSALPFDTSAEDNDTSAAMVSGQDLERSHPYESDQSNSAAPRDSSQQPHDDSSALASTVLGDDPLLPAAAGGGAAAAAHEANTDDQTAMDELQSLFRRCHHSLPFIGLFIIYFAYLHTTGIVVFFIGTIAILGLDQRMRSQIALKEKANVLHLVGIVVMCVIDMFALCCIDGDPNPLRHFTKTVQGDEHDGVFWDVLWTVVVNDFIIRLCSVAVKAIVALIKSDQLSFCSWKRNSSTARGFVAPAASQQSFSSTELHMDPSDLESQSDRSVPSAPRAASSVAFYRRKVRLLCTPNATAHSDADFCGMAVNFLAQTVWDH